MAPNATHLTVHMLICVAPLRFSTSGKVSVVVVGPPADIGYAARVIRDVRIVGHQRGAARGGDHFGGIKTTRPNTAAEVARVKPRHKAGLVHRIQLRRELRRRRVHRDDDSPERSGSAVVTRLPRRRPTTAAAADQGTAP